MAVPTVQTKAWILALFIRDDGERFLLGSGAYEFKDEQQHFAANAYTNDVVEIQGNDGQLLAGQVRRATTQAFDGYVGDATVGQSSVEQYRRDFFAFYQKNHFYTVVYVMCDGTAIQRRRGYIVDAPEVKELWQLFPEYHVALSFEDVNYYTYAEDDEGKELYSNYATIATSAESDGGLIWENLSDLGPIHKSGSKVAFTRTKEGETLDDIIIYGNTSQGPNPSVALEQIVKRVTNNMFVIVSDDKGTRTTKEIRLGSINLCKIGDSQDYIYKSGGKYYIHQETKTATGTAGTHSTTIADMKPNSDFYSVYGGTVSGTTITYDGNLQDTNTIYYQSTTTSEIEITDSTLISDLDDFLNAECYEGTTVFTWSLIDPDNPVYIINDPREIGTMTIYLDVYSGGGIEWDAVGAVWEVGGGSAITTVTNNSITNVMPTITIKGPAQNPVFANLTTNQTMYYSGTITGTQTLVIDTARKLATLNGTPVLSKISGEWLSLGPGNNRLSYATDNVTAPEAKIEWQEVVG